MGEQFDLFGNPENETAPEPVPKAPEPHRVLYFDLETQKSAEDVGGWANSHLMRLAVGVVWDSREQDFRVYLENEEDRRKLEKQSPGARVDGLAEDLVRKLTEADLVVGFNVKGFDYAVLQPYANPLGIDLQELPTLDMLAEVHKKLNHRLPLDNLARCTLGAAKSADGLQSLKWYKEGKLDPIIEYCKQDVRVTRDLFLFGEKEGHVLYDSRSRGPQRLEVDWDSEALIRRLKPGDPVRRPPF